MSRSLTWGCHAVTAVSRLRWPIHAFTPLRERLFKTRRCVWTGFTTSGRSVSTFRLTGGSRSGPQGSLNVCARNRCYQTRNACLRHPEFVSVTLKSPHRPRLAEQRMQVRRGCPRSLSAPSSGFGPRHTHSCTPTAERPGSFRTSHFAIRYSQFGRSSAQISPQRVSW